MVALAVVVTLVSNTWAPMDTYGSRIQRADVHCEIRSLKFRIPVSYSSGVSIMCDMGTYSGLRVGVQSAGAHEAPMALGIGT